MYVVDEKLSLLNILLYNCHRNFVKMYFRKNDLQPTSICISKSIYYEKSVNKNIYSFRLSSNTCKKIRYTVYLHFKQFYKTYNN